MRTYNINPTKDKYYSQLNNQLKPTIRCKPTGTVEGLDIAGWPLPSGLYKQPEDNLTDYCEMRWGPDAPEDWNRIMEAINTHYLPSIRPVIGPRWNWDLREALFGITIGNPFVASTWLTKLGHVVNIVGFITAQHIAPKTWQEIDLPKVVTIIIDDPYGDRTNGVYDTKKSGHNNHYELNFWIKNLWRSTGIQIRRMS